MGERCDADCGTTTSAGVLLPVTPVMQTTQVWCWAACSEMLLTYAGQAAAQCTIVSYWTGLTCCPFGNGIQGCYVGAPSAAAIADALTVGGVPAYTVDRALSWAEVRLELDGGRPFIIAYTQSFSGHVVVVHGYDAAGKLYVIDPYYGTFVVPYASAWLYSGSGVWSHTVLLGS